MLEKLLIFGIGYVLGTRAGRQGYDDLVDAAKKLAARDEVQMAFHMAKGLVEERISNVTRLAA